MASTLPTFTDHQNVTLDVTILTTPDQEIQQLADVTALKAFTPSSTTKTAIVTDLQGSGARWVRWDATSTATADDFSVIQPDAGGVGRWLLMT